MTPSEEGQRVICPIDCDRHQGSDSDANVPTRTFIGAVGGGLSPHLNPIRMLLR